MTTRDEIAALLDDVLAVREIPDDSLNGMQVEGCEQVERVAVATDAALAVYEKAAGEGCQMIVAHHGILWKGQMQPVAGAFRRQIAFLLDRRMSLYAAHLPLDVHADLGNNAELCRVAGVVDREPFGAYHGIRIGFGGRLEEPVPVRDLAVRLAAQTGGAPVVMPFGPETVRRVAFVSGGGSFALGEAIESGYDCLVTGEGSHWNHHVALEAGIHVVYLGHYHSETLGPRAVGRVLEDRLGLETVFVDEPTIV